MEVKKKKKYSKPDFTVLRISMEQSLLSISGKNVSLQGAGVDENEANENGNDIWE